MRLPHAATALLIIIGAGACGTPDAGSDDVAAGYEVRDSAGVEHIVNSAADRPLMLNEVLRIGVIDGDPDHQFRSIRSLTVAADGGVWVVDGDEGVRHYDADGRYTRTLGARGSGPGESDMYYLATLDGDRVLLFGVPGVLQLFDADGTLISSTGPTPAAGYFQSPVAAVNGTWIMQQRGYTGAGQVYRGSMTFARTTGPDTPLDTVRTFTGELNRLAGADHVGRASWFHGNPSFGVDGRGRIFVSDTMRYRIESWDLDGRLVRVLERSAEPRAFEAAWLDEMEAGFASAQQQLGRGRPIDRDQVASAMAAATPDPVPAQLPFVQGMLVGPAGELWVERADLHPRPALRAVAHQFGYIRHAWLPDWAAPQVFDVFDGDGRYEGTVNVPDNVAVMAVVGNRMYGVLYDELDVEYVTVREIAPGQPEA